MVLTTNDELIDRLRSGATETANDREAEFLVRTVSGKPVDGQTLAGRGFSTHAGLAFTDKTETNE